MNRNRIDAVLIGVLVLLAGGGVVHSASAAPNVHHTALFASGRIRNPAGTRVLSSAAQMMCRSIFGR